MKWTQIRVKTDVARLDELCAIMSMIDPGLMIEDTSDLKEGINSQYGELIDEELLAKDPGKAAVSVFLPADKPLGENLAFLKQLLSSAAFPGEPELSGLDEADWENSWKQYYHPLRTGRRVVIVPAWEKWDEKEGEAVVYMDPGMAFGTGTHETTRLCLSLLEKYLRAGDRVADVGTGSGILAVAAAKLGASEVVGCDLDPSSVRVARQNASQNGVSRSVSFCQSDLLASLPRLEGGYDLMSANIVADILLRMKGEAGSFLKGGGVLVLSGIIAPQRDEVLAGYLENGFSLLDEESENDWRALALKKL